MSSANELGLYDETIGGSEVGFTTVADAAPVLIWMAGTDKECTYFNKRWIDFTGRTLEQELGDGWIAGVHPDDVQGCLEGYVSSFDARQPFQLRYRLRRHDGVYRSILDIGVPRFDAGGHFLGYIGSCVDVTEAEEAAEKQRAFLRQIIDVNPNFIFANDQDGRFTLVNQAFADAYGMSVEDMIGKTHADLNARREEVEHFRQTDLEVLRTLQERFISEEQLTDAHGKVHYLQTVKRPIVGADGVAHQILGSSTDITQRKVAELEVRRQHDELAHVARLSTMGELAASLAHELNQPLTAIMANAQVAERCLTNVPADLDDMREILADIVLDSRRAADVIQRARSLVKRETRAFALLDVHRVIHDVLPLVHSGAILRHVRLSVDLEPNLPPLRGDKIQLQQVLLNLLLNAFDSMEQRQPASREVTIRARRSDVGSVTVSVIDQGTGLGPEVLDKMFQPFYTTKRKGLGMGLSIGQSIIALHGGHLWADNNPGGGATVSFRLPVAAMGGGRDDAQQPT